MAAGIRVATEAVIRRFAEHILDFVEQRSASDGAWADAFRSYCAAADRDQDAPATERADR